jgi:hypothetical protein
MAPNMRTSIPSTCAHVLCPLARARSRLQVSGEELPLLVVVVAAVS